MWRGGRWWGGGGWWPRPPTAPPPPRAPPSRRSARRARRAGCWSRSPARSARRASASESNSVVCIHAHSNAPANDNVMTTASTIDVTRRPARPSCIPTEISVGTPACRDCAPSISARSSALGDDLEADRAHTWQRIRTVRFTRMGRSCPSNASTNSPTLRSPRTAPTWSCWMW